MMPVYCEERSPEARHVVAATLCSYSAQCPPHTFLATSPTKLPTLHICVPLLNTCFGMNQYNYSKQFGVENRETSQVH